MSNIPIPPLPTTWGSPMASIYARTGTNVPASLYSLPSPMLALGPGPAPMTAAQASVFTMPQGSPMASIYARTGTNVAAPLYGPAPAPPLALGAVPPRFPPPVTATAPAGGFPMGPGGGGGVPAAAPRLTWGIPPVTTAATAAGVAPTAAGVSGSALARFGAWLRGGAASMAGRSSLVRGGLATLPVMAAQYVPDMPGPLEDVAGGALIGGGLGAAVAGPPGAIVGGIGGAVVGGVKGWLQGDEGSSGGDVQDKVNERYARILAQYGAPQTFIDQAQNQFRVAWEVQGGEDGLPVETVETLADQVLAESLQVWQTEQAGGARDPFGDARAQLEQAREYDLAQIAASQAWMEPLMTQVVGQQQQYADAYRDTGLALADQISDPAISAALGQLANTFSSTQSVNSQMAIQQMAYTPEAMQAQLDQQYAEILQDLALQEAQYQNEILANGGTLPGGTASVGGIPWIGAVGGGGPGGGPGVPPVVNWNAGIPRATTSPGIVRAAPQLNAGGNVPTSVPASGQTFDPIAEVRSILTPGNVDRDRLGEYLAANYESALYPDQQAVVANMVRNATGLDVYQLINQYGG